MKTKRQSSGTGSQIDDHSNMAQTDPRLQVFQQHELLARNIDLTGRSEFEVNEIHFALSQDFYSLDRTDQDNVVDLIGKTDLAKAKARIQIMALDSHPGHAEKRKHRPDLTILEGIVTRFEATRLAVVEYKNLLVELLHAKRHCSTLESQEYIQKVITIQNQLLNSIEEHRDRYRNLITGIKARNEFKANYEATFLDDKLEYFEGDWRGKYRFGGGANTAGLWVKCDENGRIIDHIVRKSEMADKMEYWARRFYRPGTEDQKPLEAHYANKCANVSPDHFVGIKYAHHDNNNMVLTLYSQYCKYGDLAAKLTDYTELEEPIPEPFLWAAFLQLVEACIYMRDGSKDGQLALHWSHVIHRDIKPGNVFLDMPTKRFPNYPTVKMADFGLAIETYIHDPDNPTRYNLGAGTPPFMAPEQYNVATRCIRAGHTPIPLPEAHRLWECTNVYGIGMVLYQLMNRRALRREDQKYFINQTESWQWNDDSKDEYSLELRFLVMQAILPNPDARMKLDELRQELLGMDVDDDYTEMRDYTKNAMNGVQSADYDYDLVLGEMSEYKLGMAVTAEVNVPSSEAAGGVEMPSIWVNF